MCRYPVFVCFLLFFSPGKIWSQESVSAQVFAEVIEGLSATENQSLNFGRFIIGAGGGSIIISPGGKRQTRGGVIAEAGSYGPGQFLVEGDPGASFTFYLPTEKTVLTHGESGKTMQVGGWVSDPPLDNVATLSEGARVISIGATLNVGSADENPIGIYSGAFVLTFAYN